MTTRQSAPVELHRSAERREAHATFRKILLACGIAYALVFVIANDFFAATLYEGYSRTGQAINELSARGAPTQRFLLGVVPISSALLLAFGAGVWRSSPKPSLRLVGTLLFIQGLTTMLWLLAPMSQRELLATNGGTPSDVLHLILSALTLLFIVAEISIAATAFGTVFRAYSLLSLAAILLFAGAAAAQSELLAAGSPTPWLGLFERISVGAWLVWLIALAVALLRPARARTNPPS